MAKYATFLRGINVGGNNLMKMSDLKLTFESLGFEKIQTFLQSGNVIFEVESTITDIKAQIEKQLSTTFNYTAYVLLFELSALVEIVANYPFQRAETHHAYVVFIENADTYAELLKISESLGDEAAQIKGGKNVIYWNSLRGSTTDSLFGKTLGKLKYKATTTVRNLNTLEKMIL
jgi:uncharacterized protein (DUF1697 family)